MHGWHLHSLQESRGLMASMSLHKSFASSNLQGQFRKLVLLCLMLSKDPATNTQSANSRVRIWGNCKSEYNGKAELGRVTSSLPLSAWCWARECTSRLRGIGRKKGRKKEAKEIGKKRREGEMRDRGKRGGKKRRENWGRRKVWAKKDKWERAGVPVECAEYTVL